MVVLAIQYYVYIVHYGLHSGHEVMIMHQATGLVLYNVSQLIYISYLGSSRVAMNGEQVLFTSVQLYFFLQVKVQINEHAIGWIPNISISLVTPGLQFATLVNVCVNENKCMLDFSSIKLTYPSEQKE